MDSLRAHARPPGVISLHPIKEGCRLCLDAAAGVAIAAGPRLVGA